MSRSFVKNIAVPLLALGAILLSGCAGNSAPVNTQEAKSRDWNRAYDSAKVNWSSTNFRSFHANQTPLDICGYMLTYDINEGFDFYDSVRTEREIDVLNGCIQYFNDIGIY